MEKRILLRGARQLVTLHGPRGARRGAAMRELGVIQDGAVLIVDGMIRDVGPSRRVENLAAARQAIEISADGRVVMPGFVDARTSLIAGPPLLDDYETRITGAAGSGASASEPAPEALIRALQKLAVSNLANLRPHPFYVFLHYSHPPLLQRFAASDTWIHGAFSLEQGFIFTSMILAAMTVYIIEGHFRRAALWASAAALLSVTGLMHGYAWTLGDTVVSLRPAWAFAAAYACIALFLALAPWITEPSAEHQG